MYAFVSNEYKAIVQTQRKLDLLMSLYTYPQFKKCDTYEEAQAYLNKSTRKFIHSGIDKYGKRTDIGYISIQYFIDGNNILANIFTSKFGFIKLANVPKNVKQDASYDVLKIKICNVVLNNDLIAHHCIAITNLLKLIDDFVNVELILPDISIFLACTKYTGKNFAIKAAQDKIASRVGEVFYTIR